MLNAAMYIYWAGYYRFVYAVALFAAQRLAVAQSGVFSAFVDSICMSSHVPCESFFLSVDVP